MIYLKGLNGIRAIAAIGVLISHCNLALYGFDVKFFSLFGFNSAGRQSSYMLGTHGVTMFFVLSGFLITFLLLKELDKGAHINIKAFYLRRVLRIWPLYFMYLFLVLLVLWLFADNFPDMTILSYYVFFLANIPLIINKAHFLLVHLWSIGVEEQFYLFWPHLFKNKKKLLFYFVVLVIAQFVIRVLLWYFIPFSFWANLSSTNRFDCMMLGGVVAILLYENHTIIKVLTGKGAQVIAWLVLFLIILNSFHFFNHVFEIAIVSIVTCVIIIGQVNDKNKIINLEKKYLNFLGVLSFGIYVYHPIVIYILQKSKILLNVQNEFIRGGVLFGLVLFFTVLVSWISYNYIEKWFLKFKTSFQVIKSTNRL